MAGFTFLRNTLIVGLAIFVVAGAASAAGLEPTEQLALGTRLRITVSSATLERDIIALVDSGLVDAPTSTGRETIRIEQKDGAAVHLPRPGRRIEGGLVAVGPAIVTLSGSEGTVFIPRAVIQRVERAEGRTRKGHVAMGLLIGLGAGGVIGYAAGVSCGPSTGWASLNCLGQPAAGAVGGLLLGGGIGALAGALAPPADRWVEFRGPLQAPNAEARPETALTEVGSARENH